MKKYFFTFYREKKVETVNKISHFTKQSRLKNWTQSRKLADCKEQIKMTENEELRKNWLIIWCKNINLKTSN